MKQFILTLSFFLSSFSFAQSCVTKMKDIAPNDIIGKDAEVIALWIENYSGVSTTTETNLKNEEDEKSKFLQEQQMIKGKRARSSSDVKRLDQLTTEIRAVEHNIEEYRKELQITRGHYLTWLQICADVSEPNGIVKAAATAKLRKLARRSRVPTVQTPAAPAVAPPPR